VIFLSREMLYSHLAPRGLYLAAAGQTTLENEKKTFRIQAKSYVILHKETLNPFEL
jgi:hypothetical protein